PSGRTHPCVPREERGTLGPSGSGGPTPGAIGAGRSAFGGRTRVRTTRHRRGGGDQQKRTSGKGPDMPPKKKLAALVKVQLPAGQATPAPPVGTALGPHGVNIMDFCKQYNAATEAQRGNVIPVEISIYEDRSFSFVTKTPPAPKMILKAAGLDKGAGDAGRSSAGSITADQVREIAQTKLPDLNTEDIDAAAKIVAGTAISMGIEVK